MFVHDFEADFNAILERTDPFAFIRFHDGEHALLEKLYYQAASGWSSNGADVWFFEEFRASLNPPDGVYIGVSPPCCAPRATHFYRHNVSIAPHRVTYATLFSHRNYRRFAELRQRFKDAVTVGCANADIKVPSNGVTKPWDMDAAVDKMLKARKPILVAAGPCANVMIVRYWQRQAPEHRQIVLDVGAALDQEIHGKRTRYYHEPNSLALKHTCTWNDWKPFAPVSKRERERSRKRRATEEAWAQREAMEREQAVAGAASGPSARRRSRTGYSGSIRSPQGTARVKKKG